MNLKSVYEIGKALPGEFRIESIDKKLDLVMFPYSAKDILYTSLIFFFFFLFMAFPFFGLMPLGAYISIYLSIISAAVLYIYPAHIYYFKQIQDYNEEMLKAILRISIYINLDMSMESAFDNTVDHLKGTLHRQFSQIMKDISVKRYSTLGDSMEQFIPVWNDINPVFVKSLRLLQTASLSPLKDREIIIDETTETLLINYTTLGKRFAEELSGNAKRLIAVGVLVPVLSLMLLPILSVFMPALVSPSILIFIYIIFFPTITLLMALNFSAKRVQVDTINIEDSEQYSPPSKSMMILCAGVSIVFSIPTILFVNNILRTNSSPESLTAVATAWLMSFGLFCGITLYSYLYERKYRSLWKNVNEIEQDLPHLLQSFSTYLTLNMSVENIIPAIINDYESFGFGKHPVVAAFKKIQKTLISSKKNITEIVKNDLKKFLPSKKVTSIIDQIVSFSDISQGSAAKVSKMIRKHTVSLYKLDDYMKTLLAESVGLISVTTTMLAPLLAASAVVMSIAIVKSLNFIAEQFEILATSFGLSEGFNFELVDVSQVVPPVFIEAVVGIYIIETILVLAFFVTNIKIGNDKYQLAKNISSSMLGFLVFSGVLFGGFFFIVELMFKTILTGS